MSALVVHGGFCLKTVKSEEKVMKKIVTVAMVVAFALSAGSVFASTVHCKVDSVDGAKVTMTCKKAERLKAGDKVKVKVAKKKAIEGC